MRGTEIFKNVIQEHLSGLAAADPLFSETLKKQNKNIDDCITYILNTVQESGSNGFADEEIYQMAVHYYDEDNIQPGKAIECSVVVNHKVELTEDEIQEAKQKAIKKIIDEQAEKLKKKKVSKQKEQSAEVKIIEPSLFD
ncbi:MAG: PcfK-like protein [Chitinophagaceae bacterium]|nr:PcfK-like protein [Chitinophagaceae bacterium]